MVLRERQLKKWNRDWKLRLIIEKIPNGVIYITMCWLAPVIAQKMKYKNHSGFPPNTTHANYVCAGPGRGNDEHFVV